MLGPSRTRRYGKMQFALAPRECCSSFRARGFCRLVSILWRHWVTTTVCGIALMHRGPAPAMTPQPQCKHFSLPACSSIQRLLLLFSTVVSSSTPRSASEWRNGVDEEDLLTIWLKMRSSLYSHCRH